MRIQSDISGSDYTENRQDCNIRKSLTTMVREPVRLQVADLLTIFANRVLRTRRDLAASPFEEFH